MPSNQTVNRNDPHHGEFDAVLALSEGVLNKLLGLYYDGQGFPTRFTADAVRQGDVQAGFDVVLHRPSLRLIESLGSAALLDLTLSGNVQFQTVNQNGPLGDVVNLVFRHSLTVTVPLGSQALEDTGFTITIAFDLATFEDLIFDVIASTNLNPIVRPIYEALIKGALQEELTKLGTLTLTPAVLNNFSGVSLSAGNVTMLVCGKALILAVDGLSTADDGTPITGDVTKLHDFLFGQEVAAIVHPRWAEAAIRDALDDTKQSMRKKHDDGDSEVTMDNYNFRLRRASLKIWGEATYHGSPTATADYQVKIRLLLDSERGTVSADVYDVDVDPPWWVVFLGVVLGIFTLGGGVFIASLAIALYVSLIESLLGRAESNAKESIGNGMPSITNYDLPLPGLAGQSVRMHITDIRLGHHGMEAWSEIRPTKPLIAIEPEGHTGEIYVTESPLAQYRSVLAQGVLNPNDPDLVRVWEIYRHTTDWDDSQVLREEDLIGRTVAGYNDPNGLTTEVQIAPGAVHYFIKQRIVRQINGTESKVASASYKQPIDDRLNKHWRFVRWSYVFYVPYQRKEKVGNREVRLSTHTQYAKRVSKIHRTDYPGRCRMADRYSERTSTELVYRNQVWEFSFRPWMVDRGVSMLEEYRDKLCPYCFFGGEGKDELLVEHEVFVKE